MKTKLTYLLLCLSNLLAICTYAQKVRTGFLGGANYTLPKYYDLPDPQFIVEGLPNNWDSKPDIGFFGGFEMEYDFTDKYFASSGLLLHNRRFSAKGKYDGSEFEDLYQFSVFDLQIPLMLHHRVGKFSAGLGGFAAYSIAGNVKFKKYYNDLLKSEESEALVFNNKNESTIHFKPFNAGVRAELGFGAKRWRTAANFDLGLLNLNYKTDYYNGTPNFPSNRSALSISFLYHPWPR